MNLQFSSMQILFCARSLCSPASFFVLIIRERRKKLRDYFKAHSEECKGWGVGSIDSWMLIKFSARANSLRSNACNCRLPLIFLPVPLPCCAKSGSIRLRLFLLENVSERNSIEHCCAGLTYCWLVRRNSIPAKQLKFYLFSDALNWINIGLNALRGTVAGGKFGLKQLK